MAVTGGSSAALTYDPEGIPEEVLADVPHLEGYLALRVDKRTAKDAASILQGQVAVAMRITMLRGAA